VNYRRCAAAAGYNKLILEQENWIMVRCMCHVTIALFAVSSMALADDTDASKSRKSDDRQKHTQSDSRQPAAPAPKTQVIYITEPARSAAAKDIAERKNADTDSNTRVIAGQDALASCTVGVVRPVGTRIRSKPFWAFDRDIEMNGIRYPVWAARTGNGPLMVPGQDWGVHAGYARYNSDYWPDGGWGDGYYGDPYWGYGGSVDADSYWRGRRDERYDFERLRNELEFTQREDRLLRKHGTTIRQGVALLQAGDYVAAAKMLAFAAELNHGDPACRVHLAQARLALGHYVEAAAVLRRALELQPKLLYAPINLRDYYPQPEALDDHVEAMIEHVRENCTSGEEDFLLGFFEWQRGESDRAHYAFASAARKLRSDELSVRCLDLTKPAAEARTERPPRQAPSATPTLQQSDRVARRGE
jgi:tetratricopeptide (TPR) repeat protein